VEEEMIDDDEELEDATLEDATLEDATLEDATLEDATLDAEEALAVEVIKELVLRMDEDMLEDGRELEAVLDVDDARVLVEEATEDEELGHTWVNDVPPFLPVRMSLIQEE
jgi:hypothetical protein